MSVLREPGDLARTPLAALLLAALNEKATGVLTVEHPKGTARLYLRTGMPAGAQVFLGFKPLGQYLLQRGLIDIVALNESLVRMSQGGGPQGRILVEMGAIDQPTLEGVLAEQQAGYVTLIAQLDAGAYRFDSGGALPEWTQAVRISPLKVIVDALEQPQAAQLAGAALAHAGETVALTPEYRQVADKFGWTEAERALLESLQAPVAPTTFLAGREGVLRQRARAALAALLLLGLAETSTAPTGATPETPLGLAADLATVGAPPPPGGAAVPMESIAEPQTESILGVAPPESRRSDPDDARRRRQRLLARAIQNMGIGPLTPPSRPSPLAAAPPSPGAPGSAEGRSAPTGAELGLRRSFEEAWPRAKDGDFFVRLGVAHDASANAVKQAYLALARQYHPDRFLRTALSDLTPRVKELFAALNEAYSVLSDAQKRAEYLSRLRAAPSGSGAAVSREAADAAHVDFQKGEACVRTRDFPKARAFLEAAIRGNPGRAEYKAALAATYVADPRGRDLAKAKQVLAEAMKDPACDRAFVVAAAVARLEQDEVRAEQYFRAALKANPSNSEAVREVRLLDERRKRKGEERAASKK
ncbi:MAG TPA: DnaJ domain-containing protein [Anaeromyxobacteraceae bacterium]|nr:DnaJ domain-containing protein [Anaeromyxobacteraceae bacterium]